MELLSQSHGHSILELSTTHLQHILELFSLGLKGINQLLQLSNQLKVIQIHTQLSRTRIGIIRRLTFVNVIVRTHNRVISLLLTHNFKSAICNHFISIHIRRGSSSSLNHINNELLIQLAFNHLITGLLHSLHDLWFDQSQTSVRHDASLLNHTKGLNEVAVAAQTNTSNVVVVQTTKSLHSVVSILGHLNLTKEIRLHTELLALLLQIILSDPLSTTSSRAEE